MTREYCSNGGVIFNGLCVAPATYSCPANATLSGSTCTCNTDYSENTEHNACVKTVVPQTEALNGGMCPAGLSTKAPILPATGEKLYSHSDFADTGPHPLSLSRTFRSRWSVSGAAGFAASPGLGQSWAHNHSSSLSVQTNAGSDGNALVVVTSLRLLDGSGGIRLFDPVAGSTQFKDSTGPSTITAGAAGTNSLPSGYTLTLADDDSTWQFDASGKLLSKTERNGWTTTYSYISAGNGVGQLASVTNAFGRSISLAYNTAGQLSSATMPDGQVLSYTFDSSARLITVGYPGNVSKTYVYEDSRWPQSVTGIIDERGTRLATVVYDTQGRAVESGYAGGADYYKVAYPSTTAWSSAQITDPLGTTRSYSYGTTLGKLTVTGADKPSENSGSRGGSDAASRVQNASGLIDSETDFSGVQTQYTWDSTRRLPLSTTQAAGRPEALTTSTQWHPTWRLPVKAIEPGKTTDFSYDARGNVLSQLETDTTGGPSNGQTRTWAWTYTANNLVATQTDPLGKVWSFAYNAQGQRTSATNPLGQSTSYSYDTAGRLSSQTEPGGLTTSYNYDLRGRLTQVSLSGTGVPSETTSYSYTAAGQLASVTLPNGYAISYTYDAAQRLTAASDNRGNRSSYTLDGMGNRTLEQLQDPSGTIAWATSRSINSLNRVSAIANAQGNSTQFGYDANGQAISQTDPLSHTSTQTLDGLRRPTATTLPDNSSTQTTWSAWTALGELASAQDPKGITTTYQRNAWGEVLSETSPDSGTQSYSRDAAGFIASKTDALGKTTRYQRDALGRPSTITLHDGSTQTLAYDAAGNLGQITDPSGSTSYQYDVLSRLVSKTQTVNDNPANPSSYTTAYTYHPGGQIASIRYPSGLKVFYRLGTGSQVGQIVQVDVQTNSSNPAVPWVTNLAYTALGQPKAWNWANGDSASRSFDANGRMAGSEIAAYQYDAAGRISNIVQQLWVRNDSAPYHSTIAVNWDSISHDARDRLSAMVSDKGQSAQYQYDSNSNLTSATQSNTNDLDAWGDFLRRDMPPTLRYTQQRVQTLGYSSATNRLSSVTTTNTQSTWDLVNNRAIPGSSSLGTVTYSLDAAGNLTSDGLRTFIYDASNRLSQVQIADSDEASKVLYWHNALGQRVFKSSPQVAYTAPNASDLGADFYTWLRRNFAWLFATPNTNATVGQAYVYADGPLGQYNLLGEYGNGGFATDSTPGQAEYLWLPTEQGAQLVGIYKDAQLLSVHTDHLGTPRLVKDRQNAPVWQWAYSAFGDNLPLGAYTKMMYTPAAAATPVTRYRSQPAQMTMNLRFPGQYFDSESNLSYNYFRSYQPGQGRFTQPDPIGLGGGWNRFGYVEGNPLLAIDPNGLSKVQGQPSIGGSDSAVSGITKASTKAEVEAAIKRAEEVIKDPKANPLRKKFLKGWIKVAKRGFTKSFCPPFLEDIVSAVTRELCLGGDQMACQLFEDVGGEIVRPYD